MSHLPVFSAFDVPPRAKTSHYPEPFARRMVGRVKRDLARAGGLARTAVNLTTLRPGAQSALLHRHSIREEIVYVLDGRPTLVTDAGRTVLEPGWCATFVPAGVAHHMVNETERKVVLLEIGDRAPDDRGEYPEDDLVAQWTADGWRFCRKDGTRYP